MIILDFKNWENVKKKPTLASFWGFSIGVLISAYLLRLYTRSCPNKGITGLVDGDARKRGPDLGDEALPTPAIIRKVLSERDIILRPLVDIIVDSFVDFFTFVFMDGTVFEAWRDTSLSTRAFFWAILPTPMLITSIILKDALGVGFSALLIASTLWCLLNPRFLSYFFALSIPYICICWAFFVSPVHPALNICIFFAASSAFFLVVLGLNLNFSKDLIKGPKGTFESAAWEVVMLSLPELVFVTIPVGIPITLASAPWPHQQPDWNLWQILLADNLIVIASALLYHRLLRNRYSPLLPPILCRLAIFGGIPVSLLWTYNPTWPRYIPLSTAASILFLLGTITFMDYKLLGPLGCGALRAVAVIFYLMIMLLPWLLIWYSEIDTLGAWDRRYKIYFTCFCTLVGCLFWCITILLAWQWKRFRERNRNGIRR